MVIAPVWLLVLMVGAVWALKSGARASAEGARAAGAAARDTAGKAAGPGGAVAVARRGRQARFMWWSREALHLFPVARHGLAAGWKEHTHAVHQHQHQASATDARHAAERAGWRAEMAAHRQRIADAHAAAARHAAQGTAGTGPGAPGNPRNPAAAPPLQASRAAPARTTRGPAPSGRHAAPGRLDPMPCCGRMLQHTADCTSPAAQRQRAAAATTGGNVTGSGDTNYTEVLAVCDRAVQAAEHAGGEVNADEMSGVADALGGLIRNDSETMGKAAELASAAGKLRTALAEVAEAATALKERAQQAYAGYQDAADSSDADAPQPEFVDR